MKHFTAEEIDAWLDGNVRGLRGWWLARHVRCCAACRKVREACEADRALLHEIRQHVAAHEAVVRTLPATLVVAPSIYQGGARPPGAPGIG